MTVAGRIKIGLLRALTVWHSLAFRPVPSRKPLALVPS
jgi:hypothetical protein